MASSASASTSFSKNDVESEKVVPSPSTSKYKSETSLQIHGDVNDGGRRSMIRDSFVHDRQRSQNLQDFRRILEQSIEKTNDSFTLNIFQNLFNKEEFMCVLFKLFDYIGIGELDLSEWTDFLYSHFTHSEKEKEFVEFVEVACGSFQEETINVVGFQKVFNTSAILTKKLFALIHLECQRTSITVSDMVDFFSRITSPRLRSHLSEAHVEYLRRLFQSFKSEAGVPELGKKDLAKILPAKESFFTDRVFEIFDHDNSGGISEQEFLDTLIAFASMSDDDKLSKFLFVIYDINKDGFIQVNELEKVLMACIRESKLTFSDDEISKMTVALFEDADRDNRGSIDFDSLKRQLEQHPGLLENMSISIGKWLIPPEPGTIREAKKTSTFDITFLLAKLRNYIIYFGWIFIIFGVNIGLFTERFISFREGNPDKTTYLAIARSAGQCLNFNGTILLFWMLRHSLTILRAYGIGKLFPLDHHVYFHQLCGCLLFFFACVHGTAHLINIQIGIIQNESFEDLKNLTFFDIMFDPSATDGHMEPELKLGLIPGYAFNSGVWLTVILLIMFICALPCIRRTEVYFEVFYLTHLMHPIFWFLLIVHAPNFWKWFVGPGVIFICEQIHRFHRLHMGGGKVCIQEAALFPSRVTKLVIPRPPYFRAKPGDYVFLLIPKISNFEWHPFTISSAPEDDVITVHIRGVGTWTNAVYKLFTKEQKKIMMTKKPWVLVQAEDLTNNTETTEINEMQIKTQSLPAGSKLKTLTHSSPKCNTISVVDGGGLRYRCDSHPNVYLRSDSYKYMRIKPTIIELRQSMNIEDKKVKSRKSLDSINECEREGESHIGLTAIPETGDTMTRQALGDSVEVYIDGPFGTPSSNIFDAEHAVLIATGIGVTPFASILLSIMHRYVTSKITCPDCQHSFCNGRPLSLKALKKVDFFWINRDQTSFEWFVQILSRLEIQQAELGNNTERFLDLHMYITSALERNDMKASLLQLALDLVYEKEKRDLISGLKSRTNSGRPNWEKIFNELKEQKKGRVTVFFCGKPAVAKILEKKCDKFQFKFRQEVF